MPVTVLITGFGRFPGAPFNPTEGLVQRLGRRRRPALAEVERITHVFRTSYAAVDQELPRLIARHRPGVLLMFGLAARTPHLRIETRARNAVSMLLPDAGGRMLRRTDIRPGAAAALAGRAPFRTLVRAAQAARVPARLSCDAGSYLCNYVYWRGIEATWRNRPVPIVAFVHVPAVARPAVSRPAVARPAVGRARRRRGAKRAPTLNDVARAGEAILLALVSVARTR
jgi:pyroglutamyl-peptidase